MVDDSVSVYSEPNTNSKILGVFLKGKNLSVSLDAPDGWLYVDFRDQFKGKMFGWVQKNHVSLVSPLQKNPTVSKFITISGGMTILQSQDSFSGLGLSSSPKASTRFSAEYNSLSSRYPLFLGASLSINSYTGSLLNAYGSGDLKMTYFEALAHGDYVWVRRGRILFASGVAAGFANLRIQQSFSTRAGESAGNNALDFRLENVFLTHLRGYWYLKFQLGYSFLNFNEVPAIVNLVQGTKDFNLSGVFGGVGVSYAF